MIIFCYFNIVRVSIDGLSVLNLKKKSGRYEEKSYSLCNEEKSFIACWQKWRSDLDEISVVKCDICLIKAVFEHEEQMREQAKKMNVQSLRSSSDANKTRAEVRLAKVSLRVCSTTFHLKLSCNY
jgi:hypothetical protein